MVDEADQSVERATAYEIQDEDLEMDRRALGIDSADRTDEFLSTATTEAIRNFAFGYGDDNPLYCDSDYGRSTRWNGQIAPAIMVGILNKGLRGDRLDRDLKGGRYRGIHEFASAFAWEFYRPLRPGDTVYSFKRLDAVEEKATEFAGRSVFRTQRWVKMNQNADVLAVHRMVGIRTERKGASKKGKYKEIEAASYTDEDIAALDGIYEQEQRRGSEPRYFEDLEVGDALPPMAKGPFTLTDIIAFHAGGYYLTNLRTSRRAWENRQRIPAFYVQNEQGIPDVAQRVHWDSEWARATGNPRTIDYGAMREYWLHHYLTDWIGDDGWVARQRVELRKFSYLGDAHILSGEVSDKRESDGHFLVDIEMRATNQREVPTAIGTATVSLPSREYGPMILPTPSEDLRRQAVVMMNRHGELLREGHDGT